MTRFLRNSAFFCGVLFCHVAQSQDFVDFGIPTAEELAMTVCPYDPDADAIILKHEGTSFYNDQHNLITTHHYRIKILKERGMHYAEIVIPYYTENDFEYVGNPEAIVLNLEPNGSIMKTPVDRKSFYRQSHNKNISLIKFTFPAVRVGSILEYKYQSTMQHYGGLRDWEFQSEMPVAMSKYSLTMIPNAEFAYAVNKSDAFPIDIKSDARDGRVVFEMDRLPGLRNEPYMDARQDYLQQVNFQLSKYGRDGQSTQKYMSNWQEVIRELYDNSSFGAQLNKSLQGSEQFIKMVKAEPDQYQRMKLVYNYVKSSMVWNGEKSKTTDDLKESWSKKSGSSASMNLVLVNLLQEAGLDAVPLLVSERSNGLIKPKLPFVGQFNMVMAAVQIGTHYYYLNAIEKFCPVDIIPPSVLNTSGLLMKKRNGGLVDIVDESLGYNETLNVSLHMDGGFVSGAASMFAKDYARVSQLRLYSEGESKFLEEHFTGHNPGMAIDSFETMNIDADSLPFRATFTFKMPAKESGEYAFISLNNFNELQVNPFLSENRLSNINFGYRKSITTSFFIDIPEGYEVDAVPKSVVLKTEDKTMAVSRQVIVEEVTHRIQAKIQFQNAVSWFPSDQYSVIREFYKKMDAMLNEQIVLKKKS